VLIVVGSESDVPTMRAAEDLLARFGVGSELRVSSAHRAPDETIELARTARARDFEVIIAAAGLAAHLPGVVAAVTTLPVIGVPIAAGPLAGADALHAIVQMPPGVPVATVGIGNSTNAAVLALRILAVADPLLARELDAYAQELSDKVAAADARVRAARLADAHLDPTTATTTQTPTLTGAAR
jgi:5-(carboxyamino)imidazole ribonucleotide mutase